MPSHYSKAVTAPVTASGGILLDNGRDSSFPGLCRLANGELLMVYRDDAYYHASWRGKIYERISDDEGATWSKARIVYDPSDNLDARDPEITLLTNGTVAMTCFRRWTNGDDGSNYYAERDFLIRSTSGEWNIVATNVNPTGYPDGGTGGGAQNLSHGCSGKVIELANGDLLWGVYEWPANKFGVISSSDGGTTWGSWQELGTGNETGIILDPDGTTLRLWNRASGAWISTNNGSSWTSLGAYRTGLDWVDVKPSYAYDANGALCVVYRRGTSEDQVVGIAWSDDHGATWRDISDLDATGQSMYASLVPNADGSMHILYSRTRSSTQGSAGQKPVDICFVTVTDPAE